MKGKYLFLNLVLAGMIIACNLSNTVVENAISKTETAQPTATITLIPTGTPVPTPFPTSEPLPAVIPPAAISLWETVLQVKDLNYAVELFLPEIRDTGYYGNSPCELECVATEYRYDQDQYRLTIQMGVFESREAVLELTSQISALFGESETTFIPIPEEAVLVGPKILQFTVDREMLPKDMLILQIEPYNYFTIGSFGPVLIEMELENLSGAAIEPAEASSILSYAMSLQVINLSAAGPQ